MTDKLQLSDIIRVAHRTGRDIEWREIVTMGMAKGELPWNPQWTSHISGVFNLDQFEYRVKPKVTYYRVFIAQASESLTVMALENSMTNVTEWQAITGHTHLFDHTLEE